jgi:tetratricopeptide (TPR) repeat protein
MRCSGRLGHARALAGTGAAAEAEQLLAALRPSTEAERAALAVARARNLFWALDRPDAAEAVLAAAEACVNDPSELYALRARLALATGDPRAAIAAARHAPAETATLAEALASTGDSKRALRLAGRNATAELAGARAFAYWLDGDHDASAIAAARAYDTAPGIGALRLGHAWLARGDTDTALRWFRESAAIARHTDPFELRPQALAGLAQAAARAGDAEHAQAAIAGLTRDSYELALARAWTAFALGDAHTATELVRAVADTAQERGAHRLAARARRELSNLSGV